MIEKMNVSVVIPVYNSESTISEVVQRINNTFEGAKEFRLLEIVLVNDCSVDNSLKVCKDILKEYNAVKLINLSKNFGQHCAIMAGLSKTKGNLILIMDDDLQTIPEEIPKLLTAISETDNDVVYAKYSDYRQPIFRRLGSIINKKMSHILAGVSKNIQINSFYVMKDFVKDELLKYKNPYPYMAGLIFRITNSVSNVEVSHNSRGKGESNYNAKKLLKLWINGFTGFTIKPLRLCTGIGFTTFIIGVCLAVFLVIKKLLNPHVAVGWTSTMIAIIIFSSLILLGLGLVGEYVGRIYLSINAAPQYIIKDYIDGSKEE